MRPFSRKIVLASICCLVFLSVLFSHVHGREIDAKFTAKVKENWIYYLVKLTKWPIRELASESRQGGFTGNHSKIVIGILGTNTEAIKNLIAQRIKRNSNSKYPASDQQLDIAVQSFQTIAGQQNPAQFLKGQAEQLCNTQILYIAPSEYALLTDIFKALHGCAVLTVGETSRFVRLGGIFGFTVANGKIRPNVNMQALAQTRLSISAVLLRHTERLNSTQD